MGTDATTLVRRLALPVAALAVLALLVVVPATAAPRAAQFDPCAVPPGPINVAFGASSDTPEYGTAGSQRSHGVTVKTCSWTYASARLIVSVAPKSYKLPAWPAGTKLKAAAGLGAGAKLATNTRPGTSFIAVTFKKGSRWAEVWVNGGTGTASVLRLGKVVYAKL